VRKVVLSWAASRVLTILSREEAFSGQSKYNISCHRPRLRQHARMSESPQEPDIKTNYYIDAMGQTQTLAAHSMTSSASAISVGAMLMPSAFAVLRLMTSSNLLGCRIGKLFGFSPARIRPAYRPTVRYSSVKVAP
jgi:hypothetical protein